MSSESSSDSQKSSSARDRLPFEPAKNRKPSQKKQPSPSTSTAVKSDRSDPPADNRNGTAIPEAVSRRMISRMVVLSGIPTFLGMSTFVVSYFLVTQAHLEFPHYFVVLVSLGFLGLGVLGLSYGVLSASWDEEVPGSKLGWTEFKINFDRMTSAWRAEKKS